MRMYCKSLPTCNSSLCVTVCASHCLIFSVIKLPISFRCLPIKSTITSCIHAFILQRINAWIQDVIVDFIGKHRNEIGSLITEKIKQWDAHTVTHKLELQVGRDLQYIRINGTIIGGFVGLLIYSVSLLIP